MIVPLVQVSLAAALSLSQVMAHEALRTKPYLDIAGVRTVCYGETEGVQDREYTESECAILLATRLEQDYVDPIRQCTDSYDTLPLKVQKASISLAYNIGVKAFCGSSARKAFDAGDLDTGCRKILLWNKARVDGKLRVVRGLQNRRIAESDMCLEGLAEAA